MEEQIRVGKNISLKSSCDTKINDALIGLNRGLVL